MKLSLGKNLLIIISKMYLLVHVLICIYFQSETPDRVFNSNLSNPSYIYIYLISFWIYFIYCKIVCNRIKFRCVYLLVNSNRNELRNRYFFYILMETTTKIKLQNMFCYDFFVRPLMFKTFLNSATTTLKNPFIYLNQLKRKQNECISDQCFLILL